MDELLVEVMKEAARYWQSKRRDKMSPDQLQSLQRSAFGPAWRWKRSQSVVKRGVAANIEYGSEFGQVVDYLRGEFCQTRTGDKEDHLLDIAAALAVFYNPATRLQVEARLLARLPLDTVAARSGLATQTVRDYCDVFFDILDGLDARGWLVCHVFQQDGKPTGDLHNFVCRESYFGGPEVCEHWLAGLPHLDEDCDLTTSRGREIKRLQLALMSHQQEQQDSHRLYEVGQRAGELSFRRPSQFETLSQVFGKRTAQLLGRVLTMEDDAPSSVQPLSDTHMQIGEARQSA